MLKLQRLFRILLIPMAVVLPAWVTLSHSGWLSIIYIFTFGPAVFVALLVIGFIISGRPDVKKSGLVSRPDVWLLGALYLSLLLFGFFVVDGGDTSESLNSVSMTVFGRGFEPATELLQAWLGISSILLAIITFIFAIFERFKRHS
ncbi:MAG TPA: hypothetical protein VMT30_04840 [Candidatus Saccharimonadia bacterium]|nr:hypothetical protein [Candidatus Saccharimonadia bacterium]